MDMDIKSHSGLSAILLAAGKGTRAKSFKPLLPWENKSFFSAVFQTLMSTKAFEEILVVTGSQHELMEKVLEEVGATSVFNPSYELGMHSSIKAGLTSLKPGWRGALVAQVDQPQLQTEDYLRIVKGFHESGKFLVRPIFQNQLGNPAILGRKFLNEIVAEPDRDSGCSYLFQRHPDDIHYVVMANESCLRDFDSIASS